MYSLIFPKISSSTFDHTNQVPKYYCGRFNFRGIPLDFKQRGRDILRGDAVKACADCLKRSRTPRGTGLA